MRSERWEGCQMEKGAVCVDEADTALFILSAGDTTQGSPDGRHGDASGDDEARVVFLPSSEAGSVQVHRYSDARTSSEPNTMSAEDRSGQRALQACERTQEGRERTVEALAQQLVDGDGYAMLREAISPAEARRLRNHILDALPPHKRTTRVFANHMCQIHKGVPQSPGLDPDCQPLSPLLMTLPTHPAILALARRLLGDGYRLHNAGLSLVSAPEASTPWEALALAHFPHQDLPVNKASVWGGRVPTPSHPLSLQALWLLDDFTYDNGATYLIPRSHTRAQHIEHWVEAQGSGAPLAAIDGRFPVRFVTGSAGDLLVAPGSIWHAPSTSRPGEAPRLALLFEYAPSFVEPRDHYAHALVSQHARDAEHVRIFPTIESTCSAVSSMARGGRMGGGGGASGGTASPAMAPDCGENGDVVSVSEWYALTRERPHCLSLRTRVVLRQSRLAMPAFGLGTGSPDDDPSVIAAAIRAGYRLIDTGELYGNEEIIRGAVAASGVHSDSLVLSSKAGTWCSASLPSEVAAAVPAEYKRFNLGGLYPTSRGTLGRGVCIGGAEATHAAFNATLRRLGIERLGVYLLHWPLTHAAYEMSDARHATVRLDAWRELCRLRRAGRVAAIGVSNVSPRQLRELLAAGEEAPDVIQLELHLALQQAEMRAMCEAHGILLQAYGHHKAELGASVVLRKAAEALGVPSVGLLSMRWALQAGAGVVPRSRKLEYVEANKRVFDHALPVEAMEVLKVADTNTSLYGLHEVFVSDRIR